MLSIVGDRKTALFIIISDTDDTFNFVVSILYTQLFNLLCDKADNEYGGRLPVHVRCLLDEFANIGQIPKFEKLIATIRSREISASIILLYAELFKTEDKKRCTECGTFFVSKSNSVKYCPDCRKRITRRQAAERMRKRRAAVTR